MKTLIAIPCMDNVPWEFAQSLRLLQTGENSSLYFLPGTLIYDARNILSLVAMDKGFDRVMWLDSDMVHPVDTILRLHAHMDADPDKHIITGVYSTRKFPPEPTIFDIVDEPIIHPDDRIEKQVHKYFGYPHNSLFKVEGCGFGCVMTSVQVLRDVWEHYNEAFTPFAWCGEDLAFCKRATDLGYDVWCDSSITCKHIGKMIFTPDMIGK